MQLQSEGGYTRSLDLKHNTLSRMYHINTSPFESLVAITHLVSPKTGLIAGGPEALIVVHTFRNLDPRDP